MIVPTYETTAREQEIIINNQRKEIERLNNIINKKEQFLGDNIKRLEREVVKRDNIINELEKYLNNSDFRCLDDLYVSACDDTLNKLQELKGSE